MKAETYLATIGDADLRAMVESYAESLVWCGHDWDDMDSSDNPAPLDRNYSTDDIANDAWAEIERECAEFLANGARELIEELNEQFDYGYSASGHDFYLTRNGHGAGFWDRGFGAIGDELTQLAKPYGETFEFVANGEIHVG